MTMIGIKSGLKKSSGLKKLKTSSDPVKKALEDQGKPSEAPMEATKEETTEYQEKVVLQSASQEKCYYCGDPNDKYSQMIVSKNSKASYGVLVHPDCHRRYGKPLPIETIKKQIEPADAPAGMEI